MRKEQLVQYYSKLASAYEILLQREKRFLFLTSFLRLFVFLGGICMIWAGFNKSAPVGIFTVVITLTIFFSLLYSYSRHTKKRDFYANLVVINRHEEGAISGDYSVFGSGDKYSDISHDFSNDIDLFGPSSLFQCLNRTCTGHGSDMLAKWLSDPYSISDQLTERQKSITELAENDSWYQEFIAFGMLNPLKKEDIDGFLRWIEEEDNSSQGLFQKMTLHMLPGAALVSFLLVIAGVINYPVFILIFLFNLLIVSFGLKKTNRVHNLVSKKYQFLSATVLLLKVFDIKQFTTPLLSNMRNGLVEGPHSAIKSIGKLSRILQSFDSRMNMIVGFVLNGMLLWDYQCVSALKRWKKQTKNGMPGWLMTLGEVDALISLANHSFNNPGFIYPEKTEGEFVFKAKSMGHPLIIEEKRVCNDFAVNNKGSVFIITGANMAGKSTFLRTFAVNYILAMTGSPVCATSLTFRPMRLFSSMRTTDSLSHSESYFYAELKRLKLLKTRLETDTNIFFLLDEILKGTNSTDKSTGSKLFLKKILSLGGTGIIATHDISLGEMENDFQGKVFNRCFEIDIDGENVSFDYKLRNGITSKMNAALLMKQMGISD